MNITEKLQAAVFRSRALKHGNSYSLPKDLHNPWPGLDAYKDPFLSERKRVFCGRDKESFELTRMIDDNIFVTLYGKSGNGKTSLLNAGVFPKLRQINFIPVSIRLGIEPSTRKFQDCIINAIESSINKECIEEIWGDNFIKPMQDKQSNEYLWNYFARHRFYADVKHERPIYPVIVLDQFEEIYKTRQKDADKLLCQIYHLMDKSHELESCETTIGLYEYEYNFRFVVSIREDDLYYLEDSIDNNYLQDMKLTRYRLLPITPSGARDVILKPAESEHLFSEDEKEQIVETIIEISSNGESISLNVLSLICNRVYVHYYEEQGGKGFISYDLVTGFVSDKPLEKFYVESTAHLRRTQRNYLEDNLVDVSGRRSSVSRADFDNLFHKRGDGLLKGPLKILQENNGRIELIHDSFCRVLSEQKAKRLEKWRTVVEHICLMLMCIVICFMSRDIYNYISSVESERVIQKFSLILLNVNGLWIVLFLFFVIGVIRRSFASYFVHYGIVLILYPIFVDQIVMRHTPVHLPQRYYGLSLLLLVLTISAWWITRKVQPKKMEDRLSLSTILEYRSMRIWLFIFALWFLWDGNMLNSNAWSWMMLVFIPPLFYGMFEDSNNGDSNWGVVFIIMLPICTLVYYTSDVEFLKLNGEPSDWLVPIFVLVFLVSLLYVIGDSIKDKIIWLVLPLVFLFVFYALTYHYKFLMLTIWCLVFFALFILVSESAYNRILSVITFFLVLFVYVFLKGYNPIINGADQKQQNGNWRWNNVVTYDGTNYRLLNAISGEDMLRTGFYEFRKPDELVLPFCDSVDFNLSCYLFKIHEDTLVYYLYHDFEDRIYKNSSKGRMVSLTFKKNRQRLFDLVSGVSKTTDTDANIQKTQHALIQKECEKISEILNENNDSIVKMNINRQLCKGISCDILINTLEGSKSTSNSNFLLYAHGLRSFADSYYYEDIHQFRNMDWDGEFENIVQWYIYCLQSANMIPKTQYLSEVIPKLIDYYEKTEDYGLKILLYSKIVRLQQVAILYGLGKHNWAHYVIDSPVGINIKSFYNDYKKQQIRQ